MVLDVIGRKVAVPRPDISVEGRLHVDTDLEDVDVLSKEGARGLHERRVARERIEGAADDLRIGETSRRPSISLQECAREAGRADALDFSVEQVHLARGEAMGADRQSHAPELFGQPHVHDHLLALNGRSGGGSPAECDR